MLCLPAGQAPICIECKSGEFRRDIDKYLRLRKRLGLDKSRFILCAADLTEEQAAGLSAMYDLSFVNLQTLGAHLQRLVLCLLLMRALRLLRELLAGSRPGGRLTFFRFAERN